MVDQLDFLVGSVVCNAVVDNHVEAVPPAPHVDGQGDRVPHVDGPRDPGPSQPVTRSDLHEALGGRKGEDHGVGSVSSAFEVGEGTWMDTSQSYIKHREKICIMLNEV